MAEFELPQEATDIIAAVYARDPDVSVLDAFDRLYDLELLAIGTPQSEPVHRPVADQLYTDRNLKQDVYVEEPGVPVLQVTWSGKLAVACAVFGDINKPRSARRQFGSIKPENHLYGWFGTGDNTITGSLGDESSIGVQADPALLGAVRRLHDAITGSIDFVIFDDSFYIHESKPEPDELHSATRPGVLLTREEHVTVATLPVFGSDLWETGIVPTTRIDP